MADQQKTQERNDSTSATGTAGMGGNDQTTSVKKDNSAASASAGGGQSGQAVKEAADANKSEKYVSETADKAVSAVSDILKGDTGNLADTAKGIISQVKESGGRVAGDAIGQVKEKAFEKIDERKATLAQSLGNVADTIRQVGGNLKDSEEPTGAAAATAKYGDKLARQVEQFSGYLEKHNVGEMMKDVEGFARRNPAYFIAGAFVLGLLGARFLKSSASGASDSEVYHSHTKTKTTSEGLKVKVSGEGVRPV
ncbi:MAG: hypothetical protein ACR2L1_05545 [Pyrinomonadaceae bacterium]